MQKTKLAPKALLAIALAATTAAAVAMPMPMGNDVRIAIDRALNSPTLTVRYSGATVSLVELRVNGESFATRTAEGKASGETNFNLDTKDLKDGDNDVEIRLYDRTGKLVGSEKVNVSTEQSNGGTVYLTSPKVGQTVMGPTEIKVGFGTDLKSSFVSFFVDNNFKSMTNYPPFTFAWDTTRETNGWHEVEAWAVDETSNTFKTKRVRVFVNNPGGRTDRPGVDLGGKPVQATRNYTVQDTEKPFHLTTIKAGTRAVNQGPRLVSPTGQPVTLVGVAHNNPVRATSLGGNSPLKPVDGTASVATTVRTLTPTGKRSMALPKAVVAVVAVPKTVAKTVKPAHIAPAIRNNGVIEITNSVAMNQTGVGAAINNVKSAAPTMISIVKGTRLPNFGRFSVLLDGKFVDFDVLPRVDSGVPMTPFRHLFEANGGKVKWENANKSVSAEGDGKSVFIQIGDPLAKVNELSIRMETSPYLDHGRTIVPLSFLRDALAVDIDYDKATGHVLITKRK